MHSRTKVSVPRSTIELLVREVLGASSDVSEVVELTDGMFNAAYAVRLADGTETVLKVSPPEGTPVQSYEHDLMRAEVDFYDRAGEVAPVPAVHAVDFSRTHLDRDLFFMERLRGAPLKAVRKNLSPADRTAVQRDLGRVVARLGSVQGTRFGYARPGGTLDAATWPEALALMMSAALADADRFGVRLPRRSESTLDLVDAAHSVLAQVTEPTLTHFDLWPGNVFVVTGQSGARVEAIIDGERAFWGDPLAELVSTSLFADPTRATAFQTGFAEVAGAPVAFTPDALLRLSLYRTYLCTLMLVEGAPRGYRGIEARLTRTFVARRLSAELRDLARTTGR